MGLAQVGWFWVAGNGSNLTGGSSRTASPRLSSLDRLLDRIRQDRGGIGGVGGLKFRIARATVGLDQSAAGLQAGDVPWPVAELGEQQCVVLPLAGGELYLVRCNLFVEVPGPSGNPDLAALPVGNGSHACQGSAPWCSR